MTSKYLLKPLRTLPQTRMEMLRGHIGAAEGLVSAIQGEIPMGEGGYECCQELLEVLGYLYSDYIEIEQGVTYRLDIDVKGPAGETKIFVKGYADIPDKTMGRQRREVYRAPVHFHTKTGNFIFDLTLITFQIVKQSIKLRPVRIKTNSE